MICLFLACAMVAQDPIANPALLKKQAAYKEWARAVRERTESKNKGAQKALRDKESKIRIKYGVTPNQLTAVLKKGLVEKWPTEQPKDRVCVQAILDPLILQDEIRQWDIEHAPNNGEVEILRGARAMVDYYQTAGGRKAPVAPITLCNEKRSDGKPCNRKTVGKSGTHCYEHRG